MNKGFLLAAMLPAVVMAEGPVYTIGSSDTHTFGCTPPTTRFNGEPLTEAELDFNTLYLFKGSPDGEPHSSAISDIRCNTTIPVDELEAGQWYMRATVTDVDGRISDLSATAAPFLLDKAPPSAPTNLR